MQHQDLPSVTSNPAPATPSASLPPARARLDEVSVLHLSDAEFRSETIYFIVVDRFHNGNVWNNGKDPRLNDLLCRDWSKYWGGDLQGILDKLDYLQGLGVTALWLTPLFEQMESLAGERAPIHGYWTQDFKRINERWVNGPEEVRLFHRDDTVFDRLLAEMHRRGMKFILDIVCNHSSPSNGQGKGKLYDDGVLIADYEADNGDWYHHYGTIDDWNNEWQMKNCELEGLATFNENNIGFRRHIKSAVMMWVDKGVDALRIDTVKHMPQWFWQEFCSDIQSRKPDIFIFGEWFASHPENPVSVDFANHAGMSILDFGLCHALRACLGSRSPEGWLAVQAILDKDSLYRNVSELVTFYENHDMPRLQSLGADADDLRLATAFVMTARGIPCLYYGFEQCLHVDIDGGGDPYNRPAMERWDTGTPLYRMVSVLAAHRRRNAAIQWGSQWIRLATPDLLAYSRIYRGYRCFVLLNRGAETPIPPVDTDLPADTYTCLVSGREIRIGGDRLLTLDKAAAKDVLVLVREDYPVEGRVVIRAQLNGVRTRPGECLAITGNCPELGEWDLERCFRLHYINQNCWFGEVPFDISAGCPIAYKYVILHDNGGDAPIRENRVCRRRSLPLKGNAKWRDIWEE